MDSVVEAIAAMRAAYADLASESMDALTHRELLEVLGDVEVLTRQLPTQSHRILARLQREASPVQLGAKSLRDVPRSRLRISGTEATRRLDEAAELGPRQAPSGEAMDPLLSEVASARAEGAIGPEHPGQLRINFHHHPERLLADPEPDDP